MLTAKEVDVLVSAIVARVDPQKVIIFGSYSKGTATPTSDLDILVVKETEVPIARRADELMPILANMLIRVDVHIYTPEEIEAYGNEPLSFISSVLRTGEMVFERLR